MRKYSPNSPGSQSGAALVIVLSFVMLLTVVVLTYLSGTTQEMTTSKSYSELARTRVLATTALELVKAQIWAATTETNSGAAATSWASQPGAIRTFKSGDTNLVNVYKLYSSDSMVVANSGYTPANEVPANWASRPNEYVDLNRPVVVAGVTNYPILSPDSTNGVTGFGITNATGATASSRLPMPVQWIYVLRDGSLTNSTVATAAFSSNNPIVGRIAFWTDDDTCKININTAGAVRDGETNPTNGIAATSFWDFPYGITGAETNFSWFQPAQGEYQRYPGHPARVDLRTVLTNMTASQIYDIAPRITSADTNGSFGGTRLSTNNLASTNFAKTDRLYATLDELFYATNRASNSSALTSANLNRLEGFLTAYNRAPELNLFGRPRVSMWPVNATPSRRTPIDNWFALCGTMSYGNGTSVTGSNLFLVTRSDATSATADLTCPGATIPTLVTYLQNQTKDAPPGYTASFLSKYDTFAGGRDQLIALSLDYIRCVNLYDSSVSNSVVGTAQQAQPYNTNAFARGVTNSIPKAAGVNSDSLYQIYLNQGSYVRLPGMGQVIPLRITTSSGTFSGLGRMETTVYDAAFHFWGLSWPNNTPVRSDDIVTIGGVTTNVGTFFDPAATNPPYSETNFLALASIATPVVAGTNASYNLMYASELLIAPFSPMMGFTRYYPDYYHRVTGLSSVSVTASVVAGGSTNLVTTTNLFPNDAGVNWVRNLGENIGGGIGSVQKTMTLLAAFSASTVSRQQGKSAWRDNGTTANPSPRDYPFVSRVFPVAANQTNITFNGANLQLEISGTNAQILQTLNFNFPSTSMTIPKYVSTNYPNLPSGNPSGQLYSLSPITTLNGPSAGSVAIQRNVNGGVMRSGATTAYKTIFASPDYNNNPAHYDVVIGLQPTQSAADFRWLSLQTNVPAALFQKHARYDTTAPGLQLSKASGIRNEMETTFLAGTGTNIGRYSVNYNRGGMGPILPGSCYTSGVTNKQGKPPDFEKGFGDFIDGAYARKPDEVETSGTNTNATQPPYSQSSISSALYSTFGYSTFFSPNRQVPSPGIMGGLPSRGTDPNGAWETLLFCPNPAAGTTSSDHRGFISPPDYLWMDLFTMPIVEPYAISEPFSTAGKVNMNYQIIPFTYVTRSTGMRAVLAANRITAVTAVSTTTAAPDTMTRYPIHLDETLKQFQARFDSGQIFKSPSEICSMWLYPGQTNAPTTALVTDSAGSSSAIRAWWYASPRTLSGDNNREQPYTALYQNLTTQANTYTVHVCSQALAQAPSGKLTVTGEYRGSYALERFLDPKAPTLPDFTAATSPSAMAYYQFRVNGTKQFVP